MLAIFLVTVLWFGLLAFGVGFYINAFRPTVQTRAQILDRINQFGRPPVSTVDEMELKKPFRERVLVPLLSRFAALGRVFTPARTIQSIEHKLILAGKDDVNPASFLAQRVTYALVAGAIGAVLAYISKFSFPLVLAPVALLIVGFYLPNFQLDGQVKKRMKMMQRQLPDVIDLLTISVDAGLSFDSALTRVTAKFRGPLSEEFQVVLAEMQMGVSRHDAMVGVLRRTRLEELATFITAIVQADQMGVPIAGILRNQSRQMRVKRRLRAEKAAAQAPLKMTFPMVFLIFPSIFLIILGPMAPMAMQLMSGGK